MLAIYCIMVTPVATFQTVNTVMQTFLFVDDDRNIYYLQTQGPPPSPPRNTNRHIRLRFFLYNNTQERSILMHILNMTKIKKDGKTVYELTYNLQSMRYREATEHVVQLQLTKNDGYKEATKTLDAWCKYFYKLYTHKPDLGAFRPNIRF